ncbi:putative transporter [Flavobacteriaceae bacterium Ap0902]|nr:putative transporter [Flavobacteriaceae bacterium Ap0902]
MDWIESLLLPTETPNMVQSLMVIMLAISSGAFVGRMKVGKVSLGVAAIMFTGLILGHYGYRIEENILEFIRELGLILFVYGIGLQVGPSFFSSFKSEGLKYNILAVSMVLMSGLLTYILFIGTSLPIESMVGIMSGSVTNTPGLGAATSTIQEIKNLNPTKTFMDPAIGYAITYPLGVLGIITTIILSKSFLKINTDVEMRKFRMMRLNREEPLIQQKIRVTKDKYVGKSLNDVLKEFPGSIVVSRLKRAGDKDVISPTLDMKVQMRDVMMLVGIASEVEKLKDALGRESSDSLIESDSGIISKDIYVTNKKAVHKKLTQLDLYNTYDLKVTRVYRAGREMLARPSLDLYYGDVLHVVGKESSIVEVEKIIGNSEKKLIEPDLLSLFGGLIIGIIVGSIPLFVPGLPVPIKLGFAAGPLIVALIISRYGGVSFIHSYLNNGATHFMKDLGICLFFAAVGVHAGENFYHNFVEYNGWVWLLYGSVITFIPLILMVIIGRFFMKINFLQLAGLMSGTYTDPAALSFSTSYLESDIPVQSYAQIYPLVTIFRIFVAQLLILMFA